MKTTPVRSMTEVPVIDLTGARGGGGAERLRAARAIDAACREIGFFAIVGHGVPDALVDDVRRVAHAFFERPPADKLAAGHPVEGTNRGYHAAGHETLAAANDAAAPPDLKEYFHVGPVDVGDDAYYTSALGRRHFEPNVWPAAPAGFERPSQGPARHPPVRSGEYRDTKYAKTRLAPARRGWTAFRVQNRIDTPSANP